MTDTPGTSVSGSVIDFSRLEAKVDELRAAYRDAVPWSYVVVDDFLRPEAATKIAAAFPPIGKMKSRLARLLEARSYDARIDEEDEAIVEVFEALHSDRFTAFLESVTGVPDMAADRSLVGAGLHQGAQGSYLRVHADHNTHPNDPSRFRRVNVMVYLNEVWQPDWNGDLELWDREASACRARIEPKFNRAAILSVDDTAFHGYGPLRVPSGLTRKALAAYYYADSAAEGQTIEAHSTTIPPLRGESPILAFSHRVRRAVLFRIQQLAPGTSPRTSRDN
jgi:hypothetical protein